MRQKPRSASEDRSKRRMNVRIEKENLRGFGHWNTERKVVVSEDSGYCSLDTYNIDCSNSYNNQAEINRSDREKYISKDRN